jgi:hypothetical protein
MCCDIHSKQGRRHNGASTILTDTRDKDSGLWRVPLGDPKSGKSLPQHTAQNVYVKSPSKIQLLIYMHVVSAPYKTWISLTEDNVRKYLPKSDAMVKCHMNQIRQHIRSTKTAVTEPTFEPEMEQ